MGERTTVSGRGWKRAWLGLLVRLGLGLLELGVQFLLFGLVLLGGVLRVGLALGLPLLVGVADHLVIGMELRRQRIDARYLLALLGLRAGRGIITVWSCVRSSAAGLGLGSGSTGSFQTPARRRRTFCRRRCCG